VPAPSIEYVRITDDLSQDVHLTGLPFGTRGGTQFNYVFPATPEYEIRVSYRTRPERERADLHRSADRRGRHRWCACGGFTLPGSGHAAATANSRRPTRPAVQERPQISQIDGGIRVTAPTDETRRTKRMRAGILRIPVKAGPRTMTVTFTNRTSALDEAARLPFLRPSPLE
jgi:hypothetical protein